MRWLTYHIWFCCFIFFLYPFYVLFLPLEVNNIFTHIVILFLFPLFHDVLVFFDKYHERFCSLSLDVSAFSLLVDVDLVVFSCFIWIPLEVHSIFFDWLVVISFKFFHCCDAVILQRLLFS